MTRWFIALGALGLAALSWVCLLEACSLSIDETAINDAGADAFAPPVVECFGPNDCKSSDPCVTPRCDTAAQQCVFEVCPTGDKCSAVSCTTIQTCGRVAPFSFQAGNFAIPEGLACPSCVGAVFPYLCRRVELAAPRLSRLGPDQSDPAGDPDLRISASRRRPCSRADGASTSSAGRPAACRRTSCRSRGSMRRPTLASRRFACTRAPIRFRLPTSASTARSRATATSSFRCIACRRTRTT